jgi:ATP-dependent RNA helicase SUPV3L1/SUV3
LWNGLDEFPESPPPGLVTIPNITEVPKQHYTLSGYHPAGSRAIRIDMLERLADILRTKDSRAGFEAAPEMLSITGMTLEQFSDLMAGLGYKGEKGERVKVKAAEPVKPEEPQSTAPIPEEVSVLAPPPAPEEPAAEDAPQEMEVFYTFTWAPKPRFQRPERGNRPQGEGRGDRPKREAGDRPQGERPKREGGDRPQGDRPQGERREGGKPKHGGKGHSGGGKPERRNEGAKSFEARPPRAEKPIDPDNPFAVLAALKTKS